MKDNRTNTIPPASGGKKTSLWWSFFFVGAVLLLAVCALVHSGLFQSSGIHASGLKFEQKDQDKAYDAVALRAQIDRLDAEYQEDCNRLLAQYLSLLESRIDPDFEEAKDAVPEVIDELSGLAVCVKFSYKAAKDKLRGTNDFEEAYMEIMNRPIVQPCLRANAIASDMLQTLNQQLKERYTRHAMDLAAACGDSDDTAPSPDVERLLQCIHSVAATSSQLQQETLFALVGVAFEALFIRSTCSAIIRLFAGPVAKICGSMGVGGICAAADGPFPVGDAIGGMLAVGGLVWTAYDIYDVTCVMPDKLRTELDTGIAETREKLLDDSKSKARELARTYQDSGRTLKAELIKAIE